MSMNKRLRLAAVGVMVMAGAGWAAGPDMSGWSAWGTGGLADRPAKGLVEVAVPPEVMAVALPDLGDLRVLTKAGEAVSYVVRVDRGEAGRSVSYTPAGAALQSRVCAGQAEHGDGVGFRRTGGQGRRSMWKRRGQTPAACECGGEPGRGRVGGAEKIGLAVFGSVTHEAHTTRRRWRCRIMISRYLRITVFNAPDDPERVEIRGVTAWQVKNIEPQTVEVAAKSVRRARRCEADGDERYRGGFGV